MHRVLVALFCFIFVVGINGAWLKLPTTVDEDSIEIGRLLTDFWSIKPAIVGKMEPFIYCQVIDQCCENEHRSQATSLFFSFAVERSDDGQFLEVINECVNSTALHDTTQWCSSYQKAIVSSWTAREDPDAIKYFSVIHQNLTKAEKILDRIFSVCNNEEFHAFICSSTKKLVETCLARILQAINDEDGYKAYQEYIVKAKQELITSNQQLSQLFTKNGNTN
jgi:hypothetical protein